MKTVPTVSLCFMYCSWWTIAVHQQQ